MLITMKSLQVLMLIALGFISQPVFFADTAEATPCNCEPKWGGGGSGQYSGQYYICCTNSAVTGYNKSTNQFIRSTINAGQPSRCARYTSAQYISGACYTRDLERGDNQFAN